jgi:hypothetical protein
LPLIATGSDSEIELHEAIASWKSDRCSSLSVASAAAR